MLDEVRQRGKLIAGVKYDSKPFGYLDTDEQLKGYDIELLRTLAKRLLGSEKDIEFQQVLSSTRVVAINSSSVDVVAATMTITPAREKIVDFSEPYFIAQQAILVPQNSTVKRLKDLGGKTILFVLGSTSETNIKKQLPSAHYLGFKTANEAFAGLKAGRGDAMTSDNTILSGFMSDSCGFRLLPDRLSSEPYGLAFRQGGNHDSASLRIAINKELAAMAKDGTLEALKAKWVDSAFQAKPCPKQPTP